MDGFVQVGVTAMRDPKTGAFMTPVPLFIRREDVAAVAVDRNPFLELADMVAKAMRESEISKS